ncbi:MAG: hypothetical protein ACI8U0_001303, partial [Flavobacteriales bacterium]
FRDFNMSATLLMVSGFSTDEPPNLIILITLNYLNLHKRH